MKVDRFIRVAIATAVLVAFLVAIGGLLFVTESALNVWDRLADGPQILLYAYVGVMATIILTALVLIWRLVIRRQVTPPTSGIAEPLSQGDIEERLRDAAAAGVDVAAAQAELQQLAERTAAGSVHLCFFGEISTGKSSLIRALVPEADVKIDIVGGSTDAIRHYRWRNAAGTQILLTDVPGTGGQDDGVDALALEEAQRAHVVLFVCDSDLSRRETDSLRLLLVLDKPLVLVMNKADQFSVEEQATLMHRLLERLEDIGGQIQRDRVVAVSAGGEIDVLERRDDGSETIVRRTRPADIAVLVVAINQLLEDDSTPLEDRRDRAIFQLAADKLREAEATYRVQRAEQIVRNSTRKAVIGSLAAVSPGSDIIIQGYIGTGMTRDLCKLYGAAPRDLDIEQFLDLSQSKAGRALPLSLAVAGNGLKAFPGVGTVAGGIVHAVAYGLIFDALGRSLVLTLSTHGKFVPAIAAQEFEEGISEHIEAGVRRVAKMALEQKISGD